jgi:hypothetical protein
MILQVKPAMAAAWVYSTAVALVSIAFPPALTHFAVYGTAAALVRIEGRASGAKAFKIHNH